MFYLGTQAKEFKLIDELGGKDEVVRYIENKEKIKAEIVEYKKEKTLLDILSNVLSKQSFFVGKGISSSLFDKKITSSISITT